MDNNLHLNFLTAVLRAAHVDNVCLPPGLPHRWFGFAGSTQLPPRGCFGVIQKLDSFLDDNDLCSEQFLREEKMCSDLAEILSSGFLELPCDQTVLSGALKS